MASKKDVYKPIYDTLDKTGLPWEQRNGSKHFKLYLDGYLVGVLPQGTPKSATGTGRNNKNLMKRIERAAREIKSGTFDPTQRT